MLYTDEDSGLYGYYDTTNDSVVVPAVYTGFIDAGGKVVIPLIYDDIEPAGDGNFDVELK